MKTKIHRVRLPQELSTKLEIEAAKRGIPVSQILRERIVLTSTGDAITIELLGIILKESIIARKYSAYSLANIVEDRDSLRQMAARFHKEAEDAKNNIVNSLDSRS